MLTQRTVIVRENKLSDLVSDVSLRNAILAAAEQRAGGTAQMQDALVSLGVAYRTVGPVEERPLRACVYEDLEEEEDV